MSEQHPPSDRADHENHTHLLSQAWEIARYAPIGLLVEGPFLLPKLAEMGKAHVHNARTVGRMAVRHGEAELRRRLADTDNQIVDVLRLLGLVPPAEEPAEPRHGEPDLGGTPDTTAAGEPAGRDEATRADRPGTTSRSGAPEAPPSPAGERRDDEDTRHAEVAPVGRESEDLAAADLAIPEYDSLSAPQVVQRLSGLRRDELEAVRRYELAHRGRKTILNKVAQLQT